MSSPIPTNPATITSNPPSHPVRQIEVESGRTDPCGTIPNDSFLQFRDGSQGNSDGEAQSGAVKCPIHQTQSLSGPSYPSHPSQASNSSVISCRFCSLSFLSCSKGVYEEHVNAHLRYECPVCDKMFPRNCLVRFEDHVQSHFMEVEEQQQPSLHQEERDATDPTVGAPWGSHLRTAYLLDID